ncbi:hypothetical protein ACFHW1_20195 [Micromonospora sp. LOL_014]|uniref:hypothetical protein n=2 Tax=Micromonospora TaxID=1873 RepID=UPI003A89F958
MSAERTATVILSEDNLEEVMNGTSPPTQFLLIEPVDPVDGAPEFPAVGWGLEYADEALVYFRHPQREIREVGIFRTVEDAWTFYLQWGELELIRPGEPGWPSPPAQATPPLRQAAPDNDPAEQQRDDEAGLDDTWGLLWRAYQRPGAELAQLIPGDRLS